MTNTSGSERSNCPLCQIVPVSNCLTNDQGERLKYWPGDQLGHLTLLSWATTLVRDPRCIECNEFFLTPSSYHPMQRRLENGSSTMNQESSKSASWKKLEPDPTQDGGNVTLLTKFGRAVVWRLIELLCRPRPLSLTHKDKSKKSRTDSKSLHCSRLLQN